MGINDDLDLNASVGGIKFGSTNAEDIANGSIPDGTWIIRVAAIGNSKGISGTGNDATRCVVFYTEDEAKDAAVALIKQKQLARWIPTFANKQTADNAVINKTKYRIELETDSKKITIGEYKFYPQNCESYEEL